MNPYVVEAMVEALERFAAAVARGDYEQAEDWALVAFGLSAIWTDPREAATAGETADA